MSFSSKCNLCCSNSSILAFRLDTELNMSSCFALNLPTSLPASASWSSKSFIRYCASSLRNFSSSKCCFMLPRAAMAWIARRYLRSSSFFRSSRSDISLKWSFWYFYISVTAFSLSALHYLRNNASALNIEGKSSASCFILSSSSYWVYKSSLVVVNLGQ